MKPLDCDPTATNARARYGFPRFNTRNRARWNALRRACRRAAKRGWYRREDRFDRENEA